MSLLNSNITNQQEQFIKLLAAGLSLARAASMANYPSTLIAGEELKLPYIRDALIELRQGVESEINFTKNEAHVMYLQSYFAAANSTEMKNVVDSMVKLHRLDAAPSRELEAKPVFATIEGQEVTDAQLLEVLGKEENSLEP